MPAKGNVKGKRTNRKPKRYPKKTRKYKNFRPQRLLHVGFPRTTMVKLRYVDGFSLDPGVGSLAYHAFVANSCYDPNNSGVGHQPMNFDMWSALYNHYIVVGAKITATLSDHTGQQSGGHIFGVYLSDDLVFPTTATHMMEQGLCRYKIGNITPGVNSGFGLKARCTFSAKKFFNITNITDNVGGLGADVSASPIDPAYFVVFTGPTPGSSTDLTSVVCTVVIDYIVIFSEPKAQPQS